MSVQLITKVTNGVDKALLNLDHVDNTHDIDKPISSATQIELTALEAGQSAGMIGFTTKTLMDADLNHNANTLAIVTNDAITENNDTYIKIGASGSGSWQIANLSIPKRLADIESSGIMIKGCHANFRYIKKLQLFGANPAKYYSILYFNKALSGTRFALKITQTDDLTGTNAIDVCGYQNFSEDYTGVTEISLAEINNSGIIGSAIIDFPSAPSIFYTTRGAGGVTYATSLLNPSCLGTLINQTNFNAVEYNKYFNPSFSNECTNIYIRKFIKDIKIYGGDKTHIYIVGAIEITSVRVSFTIKDLTLNTNVAYGHITKSISDYTVLDPYIKCTQGILNFTGLSVNLKIDWNQYTPFSGAITTYTTVANAGISPNCIFNVEDTTDFKTIDKYEEIIECGNGKTYTTLTDALNSLRTTEQGDVGCSRSSYHHKIMIYLTDVKTYTCSNLEVPDWVFFKGQGYDRTIIKNADSSHVPVFECKHETKFIDLTILSDTGDGGAWTGNYCIHSDNGNNFLTAGNRKKIQVFKNMGLRGGALENGWLFGCGIGMNTELVFDNCSVSRLGSKMTAAGFGFHNITNSTKPSFVYLTNCRSNEPYGGGVNVNSLGGGNNNHLVLNNCEFPLIAHIVTGTIADLTIKAINRLEWTISGVHEGPFLVVDVGMIVLKTTAGLTPSGNAYPIIFGTIDELGRGDLPVQTSTAFSLGARLGDCSSVHKTLVIGTQTCTFNTNLTSASNTEVLAIINAAITSNPCSEKNISLEQYPDAGYLRWMCNESGSTLASGVFVKRSGNFNISLADGSDKIFGFVYRPILDHTAGNVCVAKKIHADYIPGATYDGGEFGITDGVLDFAATPKVGYISQRTVYLY